MTPARAVTLLGLVWLSAVFLVGLPTMRRWAHGDESRFQAILWWRTWAGIVACALIGVGAVWRLFE